MLKRLINLARQYRSDVESRIATLQERAAMYDDPKDITDQIEHWQATLKQIDAVLAMQADPKE